MIVLNHCCRRVSAASWSLPLVLALFLVVVARAQAGVHANAYDYITSGGYSYGAQATWTIGAIANNPQNTDVGGETLHAIWVGTDNSTFVGPTGDTWVELGVTAGYDGSQGVYYYAADGINYPSTYDQVNLNALPIPPCPPQGCTQPPLPGFGETHLFSILNSHGSSVYFVGIDNVFYWSFSGHNPPSPDYGIGMESTCDGCTGTYIRRTPVLSPQWQDANYAMHDADNGVFQQGGGGLPDATQLFCGGPTSFVDALATSGVTC